jgi:phosphatidylglycerol:prolipoprotein diacylglycerol transferase
VNGAARLPRALDACVAAGHRLRVGSFTYHPWHLATDVGTVAILAFSVWYASRTPGLAVASFFVAFASMHLAYAVARLVKSRVFGISARSFLQDAVLVVLPTFALASRAAGNDVRASLDLAGLDLALGAACIRVGCFLGGCCYGRGWQLGVLYPAELLAPVRGCRTYTPGPSPGVRVFPMQLLESAFHGSAFAVLLSAPPPRGLVLPAYLAAYAVFRFATDFFRPVSARPRRAGLSEAQWTSIAVLVASATALVWLPR